MSKVTLNLAEELLFWKHFLEGTKSAGDAMEHMKVRQWQYAGLDINGLCNYACSFCVAHEYYAKEPVLSDDKQASIMQELCADEKGPRTIWFVGLEPLLNEESLQLVKRLSAIARKHEKIVGIITAGRKLADYACELVYTVDFVNVSLDGPAEIHNKIRGPQAFEKAVKGLEKLLQCGFPKERAIATAVATRENWHLLPEMFETLYSRLGTNRMSIHFVEAVNTPARDYLLSAKNITGLLYQLRRSSEKYPIQYSLISARSSVADSDSFWDIFKEQIGNEFQGLRYDALRFPVLDLYPNVAMTFDFSHLIYGQVCKIDAYGNWLARTEDLHPATSKPIGNVTRDAVSTLKSRLFGEESAMFRQLKEGQAGPERNKWYYPIQMK